MRVVRVFALRLVGGLHRSCPSLKCVVFGAWRLHIFKARPKHRG